MVWSAHASIKLWLHLGSQESSQTVLAKWDTRS